MQNVLHFFFKFYNITCNVSDSSYIHANCFLDEICEIYYTLQSWKLSDSIELNVMVAKMKGKYDKYCGNCENMNMLLHVDTVLDPMKKMQYVKYGLFELYDVKIADAMEKAMKKSTSDQFDEYYKLYGSKADLGSEVRVSDSAGSLVQLKLRLISPVFSKYKRLRKENGRVQQKSELEKYLGEDDEKDLDTFDVLNCWKVESKKCKISCPLFFLHMMCWLFRLQLLHPSRRLVLVNMYWMLIEVH